MRPHRLTGEGTGFLSLESPFESGWGCHGRVVQRTGPRSSKAKIAVRICARLPSNLKKIRRMVCSFDQRVWAIRRRRGGPRRGATRPGGGDAREPHPRPGAGSSARRPRWRNAPGSTRWRRKRAAGNEGHDVAVLPFSPPRWPRRRAPSATPTSPQARHSSGTVLGAGTRAIIVAEHVWPFPTPRGGAACAASDCGTRLPCRWRGAAIRWRCAGVGTRRIDSADSDGRRHAGCRQRRSRRRCGPAARQLAA